jgi:hypothetical protein
LSFFNIEKLAKFNKKFVKLFEFKLGKKKIPISFSKNGRILPEEKALGN